MMDQVYALGFAILIFLTLAIVMPWVNFFRVNTLRDEVSRLKGTIKELVSTLEKSGIDIPDIPSSEQVIYREEQQQKAVNETKSKQVKARPTTKTKPKLKIGFEQQFGALLPVWIGGVALALAGFFLVKYSIDNNLLSPIVRVTLGAALGVGLLYSAKWIRSKPSFANGVRISQSLAGAGIAVLYIASFASTRLYDLLPLLAGFGAMAVVTVIALILSLRHGPPIALLGMAGGFLTPALLSSGSGDAFALFTYLYFTASGFLIVIRKTKWWWLSIPTIIASMIWAVTWLFTSYHPGDSIWLGLFLLGISATVMMSSQQQYEKDGGGTWKGAFKLTSILNYIALGGSIALMGLIANKTGFGFVEWGLFSLLALGGIALAYFNDKLYRFVPWVSMAVTLAMLFTWNTMDNMLFALVLAIFAAIYIGCGYFLMFRSKVPLMWAGITGATALSYFLLAYYKLHTVTLPIAIPLFWGFVALLLASGSVYALLKIQEHYSKYQYRDHLYAVFAVAATAFISLALFIELDREFLSVAIAGEILAIAWINSRVSISALRPIVGVLACVFGLLLMPQILLMVQLTAYSLVEARLYLQSTVPIVQWPLFQLGIPALMFLGSAYLLIKQKDNLLIRLFEITAIALVAVMGYYFTRNILNPDQNVLFIKAGFFERGLLTNILFVYGLLCLLLGRRYRRVAFSWSGIVLCSVAAFRIIYFDMMLYNPLWSKQIIEGIAIFNSLLLPYGLPIAWMYFARKELVSLGRNTYAGYTGGVMLVALFMFLSLNVRHLFHGEYLDVGGLTNAEAYTYSVVWLLLGVALLFTGVLKKDATLRYASLAVILLTIGKVFLYDASELEGLFRVLSFFGLGVTLIGISYLYTRFVFKTK